MEFELHKHNNNNIEPRLVIGGYDYSDEKMKIKGDNLDQAIEKNFDEIAKWLGLYSAGGYKLNSLEVVYDEVAFDNTGAGCMTVVAEPGMASVRYHEKDHSPKTYTCWVKGDVKEELKEPIIATLVNNKTPFLPMDDSFTDNLRDDYKLGIIEALLDEVSSYHVGIPIKMKKSTMPASEFVELKPANLKIINPKEFVKHCLKLVNEMIPNEDGQKYMDKVEKLMSQINEYKHTPGTLIAYHRTRYIFTMERQSKRIKYLRNKNHLTQEAAAEKTDIDIALYKEIEAGECSLVELGNKIEFSLARTFNINVDNLYAWR